METKAIKDCSLSVPDVRKILYDARSRVTAVRAECWNRKIRRKYGHRIEMIDDFHCQTAAISEEQLLDLLEDRYCWGKVLVLVNRFVFGELQKLPFGIRIKENFYFQIIDEEGCETPLHRLDEGKAGA